MTSVFLYYCLSVDFNKAIIIQRVTIILEENIFILTIPRFPPFHIDIDFTNSQHLFKIWKHKIIDAYCSHVIRVKAIKYFG